VKAATPIEIRKMKESFRKKYPNATMSKFDFEVTFAKDGTVESRDIFYKVDGLIFVTYVFEFQKIFNYM
jgi:hypothetical protein